MSASSYQPGHFYSFHQDKPREGEQLGTVVFYLTPRWMHQWGGLLQFRNAKGDIEEAFHPRFNSMSVILNSQEHAVGCVAPFAAEPRYSITGKLMA
jgi:Rps23 Pro-64 3,4-dihydroxylase Tpa1-like proline 4-hydroxylase